MNSLGTLARRAAKWTLPLVVVGGFAYATPQARRTIAIGDLTLIEEQTRPLMLALYVGLTAADREADDGMQRSVDHITQNAVISSSSVNHITQNTVISSSSVQHITQNTVITNHESDFEAFLQDGGELPSPKISAQLVTESEEL